MYNYYFKQFVEDRNLRKSTVDGYRISLNLYSEFHELSLDDLVKEALFDEEHYFNHNRRRIKKRLLDFRSFLVKKQMSQNTIKTYFSKVKTFYKHFDIEIPVLPNLKYDASYQLNYYDLPTKEDLALVLNKVTLDFKALILFMFSSGTSKAETLSLTVGDFIKGCSEYYMGSNLESIINELKNRDDIVPTIYLKRIKTDKYYFTFCSGEASYYIIKYLRSRDELSLDDKLFPFSSSFLTAKFQRINDDMNWGKKGYYRFFRSHVLRKFHASNLGVPAEYVDALQGRSKNVVHEAYIKTNPRKLKELYVKNMHNVMIFDGAGKKEVVEEINITINIFLSDMHLTID